MHFSAVNAVPVRLHEVDSKSQPRLDTQTGELNRVLGGGLVRGSVMLIGGEPGIGKSTLALAGCPGHEQLQGTVYFG